jgi:uncharacterized protein (TIGR03643 family)
LNEVQINKDIEMACEDRASFDAIHFQFRLAQADVKALLKKQLKCIIYKLWRELVANCKTKDNARDQKQ